MDNGMYARNRSFYGSIWKRARLRGPAGFNTWKTVEEITTGPGRCLEVGPGLRPRFPLDRAFFGDLSPEAARKLAARGARAFLGNVAALPFADASFDAACAIDVVEHAGDPLRAVGEISRILRPGGRLLLAVPLYAKSWTAFDDVVGHRARFEPRELLRGLEVSGLRVEKSAAFGLLPRNRLLVRVGAWFLARFRTPAAWFEDRLVLPVARVFQRPVRWAAGFQCAPEADGIILLCEKTR
jgi:SAM-dependent methyltransferase